MFEITYRQEMFFEATSKNAKLHIGNNTVDLSSGVFYVTVVKLSDKNKCVDFDIRWTGKSTDFFIDMCDRFKYHTDRVQLQFGCIMKDSYVCSIGISECDVSLSFDLYSNVNEACGILSEFDIVYVKTVNK